MANISKDSVNLLLVGLTGNGKSSTGNSILGRKEFSTQSSSSPAANYDVKTGMTTFENGLRVVVIDGPSLGDTASKNAANGQFLIGVAETAMSSISYKLHALLVCLKYGVRFTNQEKMAVKVIKMIFGEDVIKNYGIVVMTHGDNFDLDTENGVTFEEWCDNQTGEIRLLFDECDKRCVLFDNRSKNSEKVEKQKAQLLSLVDSIQWRGREPYCNYDFRNAESSRWALIIEGKLPELETKTTEFLSSIHGRLEEIKRNVLENKIEELEKLTAKLDEYKEFLKSEDRGTGVVANLLTNISLTEMRITTFTELQSLKYKNRKAHLAGDSELHEVDRAESDEQEKDKKKHQIRSTKYAIYTFVFAIIMSIFTFAWRTIRKFLPRKLFR